MLLEVKDVFKRYPKASPSLFKKSWTDVLNGISLHLSEGDCLGIIGESGSGKSTLGRIIIGIDKPTKGHVYMGGQDINKRMAKQQKRTIRQQVSVVFQDYTSSVNARFTVYDIIAEPLRMTGKYHKTAFEKKVLHLLDQVGLSSHHMTRYPHELSGGQLQRVCIARAVATHPKVILLDEAISSLDVTTQLQILDLLIELKREYHLSYVFITHDLTAVTYMCDRVMFVQNGSVVEAIDKMEDLTKLTHHYSKKLMASVLDIDCHHQRQ
ncbi:ABC transporter ATP-binding protein [Salipaludibacillus sp. LMS25]|jgi:nickel transport system ATP-binding protein|uniref:ABC transporter ATP-binding protein n=1 Tax=Salipaludibacillus sp. LMS25 TaxID=2924031 RepID=UPI0020D0DCDB|nr:ABC transporter ATP-binding protein [Salipaludibacillus sp. LMS25]UTR13580.1 ABC transporter ATP-binding protein [Salipaludibacillus sp. LMS25]